MTTLPQMKWTEPIFGMVTRLLQDCIHFMAKNFNAILSSESFLALGKVSQVLPHPLNLIIINTRIKDKHVHH